MTSLHRSSSKGGLVALTALLAIGIALACDDKEGKQASSNVAGAGSANANAGKGGANANAGAPNADTTASGGVAGAVATTSDAAGAGGVTTTPGAGGNAAAGASTVSVACSSDIECKPHGKLCDQTLKRCVECIQSVDCTDGSACVAGVCGGTAGCKSSTDCATSSDGRTCDVARGRCVECVTAADCAEPASSECVNNACVAVTTCQNSLQCTSASAPVCNRSVTPSRCVQCVIDADCVAASAGKVCSDNQCRPGCSTNSDCTSGMMCNTSVVPNFCAACATHSDCAAAQHCSKGNCVADICAAGADQACVGNGIATCNSNGDGFGAPQACPSGQSCSVTQSRATCGGGTTVTPTECPTNPGTVVPCTEIPAYTATQVVDGKGDDFCAVPSFELSFKNAAGVNNNKVTGGSTADFTQRAVAKVAWSAQAFHAYVEVFGTPVRANTTVDRPWDGDAVELMIATSNEVTGLTSKDANTLHVIANHGVAVTVKSDGASGSHTEVPASQFKGTLTTTGYAVELKLPWPNAATLSSGAQVRFDMAMNVDTASVDPTVQGRDAQAVLAMATLSGATTCASTPPTPFCENRLWCPTALE